MLKSLAVVASVVATGASAATYPPAVWSQYDKLVCRANETWFCYPEKGCSSGGKTTAIYFIDFKAGTIRPAVINRPQAILSKAHYDALRYDAIVTVDLGSFSISTTPNDSPFAMVEFNATSTLPFGNGAMTQFATCNPME